MPASWELMRREPRVLVGILHTDVTTIKWAIGLRNLMIPGDIHPIAGMPYDMARNEICKRTLKDGYDYVFFLDSDVYPPPDAIIRLINHNKPVISGMYCRRSPPHAVPVMIKGGRWVTELPPSNRNPVIEVDLVGAGCLLIRRDLLENLPPQRPGYHWFDWRVNLQEHLPPGYGLSEDFTFNVHCREKLGVPTLVDTSIRCKHIGLAESDYGTFGPAQI